MKATGIVAEYNPFHNGHAYQIEEIKRQLQPDVIIAVMSGNFLQRGEPAIVDKWLRTEMALRGGVDLVIELPVLASTQPADYFAQEAIQILSALNIDSLSFGVEAGSQVDFIQGAKWLVNNEELISQKVKETERFKLPYAQQMESIIKEIAPSFPLDLNSPNNQLGFAYTKEIVRNHLDQKIELLPIIRKGAAYNERELTPNSQIGSATSIRLAMLSNKEITNFIPKNALNVLKREYTPFVTWEDYFPYLKYQLLVQRKETLREIYEMNEGLENRLKKHIKEANSFSAFMKKIKTRRYTQTRLQRLLTYVLLQSTREDVKKALHKEPAIRVLGFSQKGQAYLSQQKHQLNQPLIANVNQSTKEIIPFDILAGEIYQLGSRFIQKQDFTRMPVKID